MIYIDNKIAVNERNKVLKETRKRVLRMGKRCKDQRVEMNKSWDRIKWEAESGIYNERKVVGKAHKTRK